MCALNSLAQAALTSWRPVEVAAIFPDRSSSHRSLPAQQAYMLSRTLSMRTRQGPSRPRACALQSKTPSRVTLCPVATTPSLTTLTRCRCTWVAVLSPTKRARFSPTVARSHPQLSPQWLLKTPTCTPTSTISSLHSKLFCDSSTQTCQISLTIAHLLATKTTFYLRSIMAPLSTLASKGLITLRTSLCATLAKLCRGTT